MPRHASTTAARSTAGTALRVLSQLGHETLYVGVDVGKAQHVAGIEEHALTVRNLEAIDGTPVLDVKPVLGTARER